MRVTIRAVVSAPLRLSSIVLLPMGSPSRMIAKRIVSADADDTAALNTANAARISNPAFIKPTPHVTAPPGLIPAEESGNFKSDLTFSEPARSFPAESDPLGFSCLLLREQRRNRMRLKRVLRLRSGSRPGRRPMLPSHAAVRGQVYAEVHDRPPRRVVYAARLADDRARARPGGALHGLLGAAFRRRDGCEAAVPGGIAVGTACLPAAGYLPATRRAGGRRRADPGAGRCGGGPADRRARRRYRAFQIGAGAAGQRVLRPQRPVVPAEPRPPADGRRDAGRGAADRPVGG